MWMLLIAALVHPVHETVAEVEWNATDKHLEVGLRLDALDEQWLSKKLAGGKPIDQWALPYLQSRFRIQEQPKADQPDTSKYRWVGRQEDGAHVWWYFEVKPSDGQRPQWIDHRVFFERNENFTNRVLILSTRRALVFTSKRPRAKFDDDAENQQSSSANESTEPAQPTTDR